MQLPGLLILLRLQSSAPSGWNCFCACARPNKCHNLRRLSTKVSWRWRDAIEGSWNETLWDFTQPSTPHPECPKESYKNTQSTKPYSQQRDKITNILKCSHNYTYQVSLTGTGGSFANGSAGRRATASGRRLFKGSCSEIGTRPVVVDAVTVAVSRTCGTLTQRDVKAMARPHDETLSGLWCHMLNVVIGPTMPSSSYSCYCHGYAGKDL